MASLRAFGVFGACFLLASGCGDGADGDEAGAEQSVLGSRVEGDCEKVERFWDQCVDEGGTIDDVCAGSYCQSAATCYAPPPAPIGTEFSCDGLFNCNVGDVCVITTITADGCNEHACLPKPADCATDISCTCLQQTWQEPGKSVRSCTADDAGNPTLTLSRP